MFPWKVGSEWARTDATWLFHAPLSQNIDAVGGGHMCSQKEMPTDQRIIPTSQLKNWKMSMCLLGLAVWVICCLVAGVGYFGNTPQKVSVSRPVPKRGLLRTIALNTILFRLSIGAYVSGDWNTVWQTLLAQTGISNTFQQSIFARRLNLSMCFPFKVDHILWFGWGHTLRLFWEKDRWPADVPKHGKKIAKVWHKHAFFPSPSSWGFLPYPSAHRISNAGHFPKPPLPTKVLILLAINIPLPCCNGFDHSITSWWDVITNLIVVVRFDMASILLRFAVTRVLIISLHSHAAVILIISSRFGVTMLSIFLWLFAVTINLIIVFPFHVAITPLIFLGLAVTIILIVLLCFAVAMILIVLLRSIVTITLIILTRFDMTTTLIISLHCAMTMILVIFHILLRQ